MTKIAQFFSNGHSHQSHRYSLDPLALTAMPSPILRSGLAGLNVTDDDIRSLYPDGGAVVGWSTVLELNELPH